MYSGAKNLFDAFEKEANDTLNLLQKEPSKLVSVWGTPSMPITFDSECLCGLTPTSMFDEEKPSRVSSLLYRKQQCSKCIGLAHTAGKYSGEKVYDLTISCGHRSGESYLVHPTEDVSLSMEWDRPINSEWLVSCDAWTNNLLINWYCSHQTSGILPIFGAYICGDTGHTIVSKNIDVRDLKDVSQKLHFGSLSYATASSYVPSLDFSARKPKVEGISVDTAKGLVHQLAKTFSSLSSSRFVHGNACSKNLVLLDQEAIVPGKEKDFSYPLRLALRDFSYSSVNVGRDPRVRLSRNTFNDFSSTAKNVSESLTRYRASRASSESVDWLLFNDLSLRSYRNLHKHVQESASVDFILFVLVLMANKSFDYTVRASSLREWFDGLWMPSERENVDEKIEMLQADPSRAQDCSELLFQIAGSKPLSIRTDAIEYTLRFLEGE